MGPSVQTASHFFLETNLCQMPPNVDSPTAVQGKQKHGVRFESATASQVHATSPP